MSDPPSTLVSGGGTMTRINDGELIIECACPAADPQAEAHLEDCLVGAVMDRIAVGPGAGVVFDAEEARALRALRAGGLLPGGGRLGVAG